METFALSGKNLPSSRLVVTWKSAWLSCVRELTPSSRPPKPSETYLPCTLTEPMSESCTLRFPSAAHPPLLLYSLSLSSLTHTSPLFCPEDRFLTPMINVFTSPRVGLPIIVTLLLGWLLS